MMNEMTEYGVEPAEELAGVPDGFQRLWVPHRMAYISGENRPQSEEAGDQCPFCRGPHLDDDQALIVYRGEYAYVILNLYPYNSGHVLICPYRHISLLSEASGNERAEISFLSATAMRACQLAMNPDGFNLGINQGAIAGAGVAGHLHQHVIPRWGGDTNFFPIVGRTRALPYLLADTRAQLAEVFGRALDEQRAADAAADAAAASSCKKEEKEC